ncbi:hypothetical protein DRH29_01650 [candidate division Kazan bacterium]|uniref:Homing endonuclease LAGLIDADG domain-containing protein n=1 Tax=candidate division Kazan bacterium TaxID=2202143 RepID=A0A420ZDI0_UNCK3|nr:MAG: hypothetical protein DRH29_01650 [candidate division Kazan bacterium]
MTETLLAYIAGFLDGDGCIMAQLVKRKGYIHGYQIRVSIVFYQKETKKDFLEWLKNQFKFGYVRVRNDQMAEYTIVGYQPVYDVLTKLLPYLRLKKTLAQKVIDLCVLGIGSSHQRMSPRELLKRAALVDETAKYNYSKKRTINQTTVKKFLQTNNLFPRND